MRILIVNYTGEQPNPGCQATSNGLIRLLYRAGASHIDTFPLGAIPDALSLPLASDEERGSSPRVRHAWNELKRKMPTPIKKAAERGRSYCGLMTDQESSPTWVHPKRSSHGFVTNLDLERWLKAVESMGSEEVDLLRRLDLADRVVVNGEGTLHHNQRTALTALAVARTAQILGKEVHVVNTSVQAMHPEVLTMVLGSATWLVVREPRSYRYLRDLDIDCQLGSDCAFAAIYGPEQTASPLPAEVAPQCACLVTGGCGARTISVLEIIRTLRRAGYSPFYYRIGDGDPLSVEQCTSAGIPVVTWDSTPWNALPDYLKQVKLVVSGRHHMIIFALMARIPFIPLSSNTWKIEGLCELFRWPIPVLPGAHGFVDALSSIPRVRSDMSAAFQLAARKGFELATKNVVGSLG